MTSAGKTARADSVSGTIAVTGTTFDEQIILRTSTGVRTLVAQSGADSAALRRLSGVEIVARGRSDGRIFLMSNFLVTRAEGRPVTDGVLRQTNGRLVIATRTGTYELGNPPTALQALVGARVWLSGPLDSGPTSFGLITPPR
jgi:hypothetical protein